MVTTKVKRTKKQYILYWCSSGDMHMNVEKKLQSVQKKIEKKRVEDTQKRTKPDKIYKHGIFGS
jgi:hypothetical protein